MPLQIHLVVLLFSLVFVAAVVSGSSLRRDAFFLFVLAQAVVYCFLAPACVVFDTGLAGSGLGDWYLYAELLCLLVFLPVFVLTHSSVRAWAGKRWAGRALVVNESTLPFFAVISGVGTFVYVFTLLQYDLLFRRIGHQALAAEYLHLPGSAYLIIRTFDRLLLSLVMVSYIAFHFAKTRSNKRLTGSVLAITLCGQLLVVCLNSRFALVVTFALLSAVYMLCESVSQSPRSGKASLRLALAGLAACAGIAFTVKFRDHWQGTIGETLAAVVSGSGETDGELTGGLLKSASRLDGIDLIARMGPAIAADGASWGRSWYPSVLATVGYLWDAEGAKAIKASLATTPKYYLMYEYAGINQPDYQSCILTDAYGNFRSAGFAIAAIVLATSTAIVSVLLVSPGGRLGFVVAVAGLQVASSFESALLSHMVFDWLRHVPSMVVLYLICPLRTVDVRGQTSARLPLKTLASRPLRRRAFAAG
ncbi:MAG: hypothetical protein AAGA92_03145 [Planctomycetota bacterium]